MGACRLAASFGRQNSSAGDEHGRFEEIRRLEQVIGCDRLAEVILGAEPGWIDERSWEFWRGRLTRATGRRIPDEAPVRSFDAGEE